MGQLWYYEQGGSTEGPLEIDQLRALISDGSLSDDSQVKSESMQEWVSVSSLRDEIDAVGEPGIAPLDDELDDRNSGLNIDDFNLESGGDGADEDLPDIDSFVVAGDNDSPKPEFVSSHKPKEEPEPEEEPEEEFLVRSLGMTLGPLTYDEIVDMARTGSLTKGDEIKVGESEWIAVESIAQVSTAVEESSAGTSTQADVEDSTAGKKSSRSGKPRKKASRKSSAGKSSAGRKRRRKKKKKDEFLAEIFAEVFTEDGKVRHERTAAAAAPAAPAAAAGDAGNPQMAAGAQPGMAAGNMGMGAGTAAGAMAGGAGAGGGMNGMNGMGSPDYASQQAAHPAFKAPPKPKARPKAKAKKSKGGQSFEMPEPKVLGMIGGGVLAAIILIGGYTGVLPIPGFGVDPDTFFKEVAEVYPIFAAGDKAKWKTFHEDYGSTAEGLMQSLAESAKSDPTAKRHYNAAKAVVKLTGQPHHFKEGQKEAFREFQKILVGG
ncbi:MAG: DUF4339 domain-containing protein [Planctomycetaceae bacterium]|nr:DUF4339 domain-containing protein [Planctomycetaceae bacterium]